MCVCVWGGGGYPVERGGVKNPPQRESGAGQGIGNPPHCHSYLNVTNRQVGSS